MRFLFYITTISSWLPLDLANYFLEINENKEIIQLSNGLKIYYIESRNEESIVNFRYEIHDTPSNTCLYHLLEHLLTCSGNGFRKYIDEHLGRFYSNTCVSSMSFTFNINTSRLHEIIDKFYETIYHTDLDKTQISREIDFIDEETSQLFPENDHISFYLHQYFTNVDSVNLSKLGDAKCFEKYYFDYIAHGYYLSDNEVVKFSSKKTEGIIEGYHCLLSFLLSQKFRKFPFSVLIRTSLRKNKIIKIFESFDKIITNRSSITNTNIQRAYNTMKFHTVLSTENNLRLLIKYNTPRSVKTIKFFKDALEERLKKIFDKNVIVGACMIEGISYICVAIKDFCEFDYNLLQLYVFNNEEESKFLTFDELEYFFKFNESYKSSNLTGKNHKKTVIVLHLFILKFIEKMEFDSETINLYSTVFNLNSYKIYTDMVNYLSFVHHMVVENESLISEKDKSISIEEFNEFKNCLMEPKNYFTFISHKTQTISNQYPIKDVEYFILDLGFEPKDYLKDNSNLPKNPTKRLKGFDVVVADCNKNSFSLIFLFGLSLDAKIAMILLKEILREYRETQRSRLFKLGSKVTIIATFENTLIIHITADQKNFSNVVRSFLIPLKIMAKNMCLDGLTKALTTDKNFKDMYPTISNEKIEDINRSLKKFHSLRTILDVLQAKCMYFGKKSEELINYIVNQLNQIGIEFVDKSEFPLVYKNMPYTQPKMKGFNYGSITVTFADVETLEDLIINKIIFMMFKINATSYFLHTHRIGHFSKVEYSNGEDFSSIRATVISKKSVDEIAKNISDFITIYRTGIISLSKKNFEKARKMMLRNLIPCDKVDDMRLLEFQCKWGFIEGFETTKEKIKEFLMEKLTLELMKKVLIRSSEVFIKTF